MHKDTYIQALIKEQAFFEIHQEEVLGSSMEVFKNRPRSLVDFLELSENHGEQPYLIYQGQTISFAKHLDLVKKVAHILQYDYGVEPGDRVAIYAANCPHWIIFFWATISIGGIACGLNGWWKGTEALKAIEDANPKLIAADQKRFHRINQQVNHPALIFENLDLTQNSPAIESFIRLPEDECACLLYTSGTTGAPKGVMTSHRSMIANSTLQMLQGAAVSQDSGSKGIDWARHKPTSLLTSPLFHVSGLSAGAVTSLFAGSTTLVYDGRFSAQKILDLISKFNATSWGGAVPTALKRVLDAAEASNITLDSILVVGGGGAPMPPALIERTKITFPNSKYSFGYGYGLTESGAITIINWGDSLQKNPSSPGQAMPTIHIEIRDEEGQVIKEDHQEGEIFVRSPSVMLGYFNNLEATNESLLEDRWLKTGDFGYQEGHLFFISSRRTDLILRGAENVYPQEIEIILDLHPMVEESAVIGLPHDDLGQEVAAVVRGTNPSLSEQDLSNWVATQLADFKVPSKWIFSDHPLPRNASGKLMKHVLIDASKNTMVDENE
ncbi:acyl--CoA ligase [Gammaproteobacteria bacterium]|nr:acyl--CoA ligase [Gammaproteobacteria bacterium]MDB9896065.1 acyl--CoA ligase [Gammaproteobacteria bacterium]MDC1300180.1 acyl--CoA ligase [Gammaproteobacteria bacterium]